MGEIYSEIIGTGSYLPEKILTNDDLSKMVDTSDEWIYTRTGIKQRHIAADNEYTSDLAVNAIKNALDNAKISAENVDLLIVATITPDLVFPSTSCIVQKKLGLKNAVAFDVSAACSGFVYGLTMADAMIKSGAYKTAVVVGAETLTRIMDWNDRTTCVLFGDGAGAAVLRATTEQTGIMSYSIKTDGNYLDCLNATGGLEIFLWKERKFSNLLFQECQKYQKKLLQKQGKQWLMLIVLFLIKQMFELLMLL